MRRFPVPALAAGLLACLAVLALRADDPPKPGTKGNPDNVPYIGKSDPKGNPVRLAKATGHVSNYSEDKVSPYTLPDPLVLSDGQKVTSPEVWVKKRRSEILKFYQTEIYGRVPAHAPKVTWEVTETDPKARDGAAVLRRVVGRIGEKPDGPKMTLTVYTPAKADKPVPVLLSITFGSGAGKGPQPKAGTFDPVAEVLGRGWAYATIGYGNTPRVGGSNHVSCFFGRGRDGPFGPPPAQIRTSGITASGSVRLPQGRRTIHATE